MMIFWLNRFSLSLLLLPYIIAAAGTTKKSTDKAQEQNFFFCPEKETKGVSKLGGGVCVFACYYSEYSFQSSFDTN